MAMGKNRVLEETGFDAFAEKLCAVFHADRMGRPSNPSSAMSDRPSAPKIRAEEERTPPPHERRAER